ncbi:MAG TPA: hypothetical protein PKI93_00925 [Alphaproteobacteria bacterium]|nr:hypothetical protein [Alphaproteobacteria bacterium]HNS44516.1 hypothetical protein [Alphaproteobacteria bacterium]
MSEKIIPTAKVVDGILILSLPDATFPVVWQMEVGQSKSSALEVRPAEHGDGFTLVLKTPRQDVLEIAQYDSKEHAVRALITVSAAMEKAQGQIRTGHGTGQRSQPYDYSVPALRDEGQGNKVVKFVFKPLGYIVGALLLFAVLLLLTSSLIGIISGPMTGGSPSSPSSSTQNAPMSAEDFLEGR